MGLTSLANSPRGYTQSPRFQPTRHFRHFTSEPTRAESSTLRSERLCAILIAYAVLFAYHGQPCILMCDPLQLTDETLVIPQQLALVLALCDGTHENASVSSASRVVVCGL
jgi:hypothetical protein